MLNNKTGLQPVSRQYSFLRVKLPLQKFYSVCLLGMFIGERRILCTRRRGAGLKNTYYGKLRYGFAMFKLIIFILELLIIKDNRQNKR